MPQVYRTKIVGDKRIFQFTCGHFLVAPLNKEEFILNRKCSACDVGRSYEQNLDNVLEALPEAIDFVNEKIF